MSDPFPPHTTFGVDFLRKVADGYVAACRLERGSPNSFGPLGYYGDLLHIDLPNRHVVYRLGRACGPLALHAHWPD